MTRGLVGEHVFPAGRSRCRAFAITLLTTALAAPEVPAVEPPPGDFADLSLEQLGNIEITSVSKRAEPLSGAPASIFVITGEDIRRSGVTNLPDALRLAPNLQVARVHGSGYSISARGFNNSAGNKLLVLIDGRSVYTPLFSGVFWDVQDVMIEDIERIEVISGPGGTLWGTNAVNGVINVITRSAKDTQGGLIAAGGGNTESGGAARYGGAFGADGHYRIYGKYFDRDHTSLGNGSAADDAWHMGQAGFRADWGGAGDQFTVQGDAYSGNKAQPAPGTITISGFSRLNPISISGANLLTRWRHRLDGGSDLSLQAYYDHTERDVPGTFDDTLDIVDLQFQHSLQPAAAHALVWGAEFRYGMDRVANTDFVSFLPADVDQVWASLFAQDEIALRADVRLTLGARLERNDYTGNEFLPNARLAWKVAPDHLLWTAASRTVRAPSRIDRDFFVAIPPDPTFVIQGGPEFRSEVANVYELGYRGQPCNRLTYSVTAFYAEYDHLRTLELAPSGTFVFFANEMDGTSSGVEMWATWQAADNWRVSGGFTTLHKELRLKPGSQDANDSVHREGNDPDYSWNLRSTHNLFEKCELDVIVRGVASLPATLTSPEVPAYTAVDARFGWKAQRDVELSLTLQNLFDPGHIEFGDPAMASEIERAVFLKLVWRQ
jgi:iron complex outermembrane receptor protein